MKVSTFPRRRAAAFTLVELLVATALGSVVMGWVGLSFVSLQRSFEASNYQMTAQNDQLRVLDYLSRDLRMASAVATANGSTKVVLTLSADGSGTSLNLGPLLNGLLGGSATGGASTRSAASGAAGSGDTVAYYVEGGQFIREFNGTQTVIADTVAGVTFTPDGAFLKTDVLFTPRYSCSPTTARQPDTRASNRIFLRNAPPAS